MESRPMETGGVRELQVCGGPATGWSACRDAVGMLYGNGWPWQYQCGDRLGSTPVYHPPGTPRYARQPARTSTSTVHTTAAGTPGHCTYDRFEIAVGDPRGR